MASSTTSPATILQPAPHHDPAPYYGTALEPDLPASAAIAQANRDLARRRIAFGRALFPDELAAEYDWALDRLVRSGVCKLAAPVRVEASEREAWLQIQLREIESFVRGSSASAEGGSRLTDDELAQMGLLPARALPPGPPFRAPHSLQTRLAQLHTRPNDEWVIAPMLLDREVIVVVIPRGSSDALPKAALYRDVQAAYFWEEFSRQSGQTWFSIIARLETPARTLGLGTAPIRLEDEATGLSLPLLAAQPTLSFHFFAPGHWAEPLFTCRLEWPVPDRHRIVNHIVNPLGRAVIPGLNTKPPIEVDARDDPAVADSRWQQTLGLLSVEWQMRESLLPGLPGLDEPSANLYWGELNQGAYIRLAAQGGPQDVSLHQLVEARWGTAPSSAMQAFPGGGKAWRGIVASMSSPIGSPPGEVAPSVRLSFYWNKQNSPLAALRHIAEIEAQKGQVVPAPLMAALYATAQCYSHQTPVEEWAAVVYGLLAIFLQLVPVAGAGEAAPPLSQAQLDTLLQRWLRGESLALDWLPANPYSLVQFFWGQGRLLWTKAGAGLRERTVSALDLTYLKSYPPPYTLPVEGSGVLRLGENLSLPTYALGRIMWELFTHLGISKQGLEHLLPGSVVRPPQDYPLDNDEVVNEYVLTHALDPDEIRAWVRDLLLQATEQGWYAPAGRFRVPTEIPSLQALGITEIRGYIDSSQPRTMWLGLVAPDRRMARIVCWSADARPDWDSPPAGWEMLPQELWPAIDFVGAALWRDMVILGPAGFPQAEPTPTAAGRHGKKKPHPASATPPTAAPVHVLPRRTPTHSRQPWPLTGEPRQWGSPEERRYIQRRGCDVPGLYRVHLYKAERWAAPLQAALADPPVELWRERHRAAQRVRDTYLAAELAAWWETMLSAAGAAAAERKARDIDRVLAVETVLAGQLRRAERENQPRLAHWLTAGLQALEDAKNGDASSLLAESLEQLQQQRDLAGERAARFARPAPPAGYTFVRPYARVGTRGEPAETTVPVIQAKGLLVVQTVLSRQRSCPEETEPDEAVEDESAPSSD